MSERPSLKLLAMRLYDSGRFIPEGTFWRHTSGKTYEVIAHAIEEATSEPVVIYREVRQPRVIDGVEYRVLGVGEMDPVTFSRPMREWIEVVDWHDGEMKRRGPRFDQVYPVTRYE